MQGYEYPSEFARTYYRQGKEEGREEGREQGREEGMRAAVLALARAKRLALTAAQETAIGALHDERRLTELIGALGAARSAEEARSVLEQAIAAP
ncbi:MAG TPA: hypothetical protein VFT22_34890 [Kofleriaceae bacterium]|nr:hypothetical protein [Kofleriaceae bacterium]